MTSGMQKLDITCQHEIYKRIWSSNKTETTVEASFHIEKSLHMSNILIVAPTNNAFDVIEERLLDGMP